MSFPSGKFRGVLLGAVYTDAVAFEKAAKRLGYRSRGKRSAIDADAVGTEVVVLVNNDRLTGQIWARHPEDGCVWIACSDGRYYRLNVRYGEVYDDTRPSMRRVGQVVRSDAA